MSTENAIIEAIEHELSLADEFYKPQPMFSCVWFYPLLGIFLYADAPVKHEVAYNLIKDKKIKYTGLSEHQGEVMVKYELISQAKT